MAAFNNLLGGPTILMDQISLNLKERIVLGKKLITISFKGSEDLDSEIRELSNKNITEKLPNP